MSNETNQDQLARAFLKKATSTAVNRAIRERSPGGPNIVRHDGSPASTEEIEAYYAGEYSIVDTAPNIPRQSWEI